MKKLALLLLLTTVSFPAYAAKRVTADQVEHTVDGARLRPDADVARDLADFELSERVSTAKLLQWKANLPGPKAQQALIALVDASAFLDPPPAEVIATAAPDFATQRKIMSQAATYVSKTIPRLPNFFATRTTARFEDTPSGFDYAGRLVTGFEPIHAVGTSSATVLYRNGKEVVEAGVTKTGKPAEKENGLSAWGIFGPGLGTVLVDAARSKLEWGRWERGEDGPLAVFRFAVPKEKSNYAVNWCCAFWAKVKTFQQLSAYHGEMAIDPVSGTILRLTLIADLAANLPVSRADVMVEYGPVEIGGATYICPVRSVSKYAAWYLERGWRNRIPQKTMLNDVSFGPYHLFRAETRILTDVVTANDKSSAGAPPAGGSADSAAESKPADETTAEVSLPPDSAAAPPAPADGDAEVSITEATELPGDEAAKDSDMDEAGFVLRSSARTVGVGVVAVDAQGHRVTDLKPDDFVLADEGAPQRIQSFTLPGAARDAATSQPGQRVFSNPRAANADAKPAGSETILLMDASGAKDAEMASMREAALRLLNAMPADQRVGLFAMTAHGFKILSEATAHRALLAERLKQWTPVAEDMAATEESEPAKSAETDDAQSKDTSIPSSRSRFVKLTGVARHLAETEGHKNVLWIMRGGPQAKGAESAGNDKKKTLLDGRAALALETLNEAHVSIYPFDPMSIPASAMDPHSAVMEVAAATGGRAIGAADDLAAAASGVAEDGRAGYLLRFTPDVPADGQYHRLMLKVNGRPDLALHYRMGYLYEREAETLNDRFREAVWQPNDANEIAVTAEPVASAGDWTLKLNIGGRDVELTQQNDVWTGKLDIFLVKRDDENQQAEVTGQSMRLKLKAATREKDLQEGISFDQAVELKGDQGSIRVVVVDENSGRMGSVTIPATAMKSQ